MSDSSTGNGFIRKLRSYGIQFFILLFIIGAIFVGSFYTKPSDEASITEGWTIIRPPGDICTLAEQGDILWAGGSEGVYRIDRINVKLGQKLQADANLSSVKSLIPDGKQGLWIGTDHGLFYYDGTKIKDYTNVIGLTDNRVNCLYRDSKYNLWIGTWSGAFCYDGSTVRAITEKDGLINNMVNCIFQDSKGGYWFGSYCAPKGGLCCLSGDRWQYFSISNGLPHNNVNAILEDKEGGLWVATGFVDRGGACEIKSNGVQWYIAQTLKRENGLAGEKVRSIFQDSRQTMWFGSEYDGLAYIGKNSKGVFTKKNGLSDNEIKVIIQDIDGNLWMGTHDGITQVKQAVLDQLSKI